MLIRIELDDGSNHQWGFRSKVVPTIGDTLWLWCELPGEEKTGNQFLEAVVVRRRFAVESNDFYEQEVTLIAHSSSRVPGGFIADSPEWSSDDKSLYHVRLAMGLEPTEGATRNAN